MDRTERFYKISEMLRGNKVVSFVTHANHAATAVGTGSGRSAQTIRRGYDEETDAWWFSIIDVV